MKANQGGETKKKTGRIILLSILGVIVVLGIVLALVNKNKAPVVTTTHALREDLSQNVSLSGTVQAVDSKAYFADISAGISQVGVKAGDVVERGDVLFAYDEDDLDRQIQIAELQLQSAEGSYDNQIQTNGKTLYRLGESKINLQVLEQQIADFEAYEKELKKKISEKQTALEREGTLLQISLIDWSNQPYSEEYLNLQKLVQENAYEQKNNAQIKVWQTELEETQSHLSECRSYQSQMKSQGTSSTDGAMTEGAKEDLEANVELQRIEKSGTIDDLKAAKGGVKADFRAIVKSVDVVPGTITTKGMSIMTLESLESVVVKVKLTKFDLERVKEGQEVTVTINGSDYPGKISKISALAEKSDSGAIVVPAEITVLNADNNIILGTEAKANVISGEVSQVLTLSTELINIGSEGSFVWVVRDGILTKAEVETGLSDDYRTEIISGITEDDQVVSEGADTLEEGAAVTAVEG